MAKCSIDIQLDAPERKFLGGDTVRGEVRIVAHQAINCDQIQLKAGWLTHGRGNRDRQNYYHCHLHQGPLEENREYRFRFEYRLPHYPMTYRGKLINIEHHIEVRVYIPWAFDPKGTLDLVVSPAPTAPHIVEIPKARFNEAGTARVVTLIVATALLLFGVLTIPLFGLGLLLIAFSGYLFFLSFRKWAAEQRLGKVQVSLDEPIVAAGRSVVPRVEFVPAWNGRVNVVTAALTGKEIATSGSGTNRRTHTEVLYQDKQKCIGPKNLKAGELTQFFAEFELPKLPAYSFEGTNNRIIWQVELHVDIPNWPDWIHPISFTVVPEEHMASPPAHPVLIAESVEEKRTQDQSSSQVLPATMVSPQASFAEDPSSNNERENSHSDDSLEAVVLDSLEASLANESEPQNSASETSDRFAKSPDSTPNTADDSKQLQDIQPPMEQEVADQQQAGSTDVGSSQSDHTPPPPLPSSDPIPSPNLEEVFDQFSNAKSYGGELDELIASFQGVLLPFAIDVDRVTSTIGSYSEPEFSNGKTVTGKITGSKAKIEIECHQSLNEQVADLRSGDRLESQGKFLDWDPLFQRLKMRCNSLS